LNYGVIVNILCRLGFDFRNILVGLETSTIIGCVILFTGPQIAEVAAKVLFLTAALMFISGCCYCA